MATSSEPTSSGKKYVGFDEYVAFQLKKARTAIRSTDVFLAFVGVASAVLAYLLLFVIVEHWLVPQGIGPIPRALMLGGLLIGCGTFLVRKVVAPYLKRVNDLYAARMIEQAEPRLNSSLLNLVDLSRSGRDSSPAVRTAMERHAAVKLAEIDVDETIDHRPLLRLSYVMLALVVLSCLYAITSPKRISNSVLRALLPFSHENVATRTQIVDVKPGDAKVLARSELEVIADVAGDVPDRVILLYTTSDRRHHAEPVEMREMDDGLKRFRGVILGENGRGVLQDFSYHVRAGDARSRDYRVTVMQPPSASVQSVLYEYPSYMQLQSKTSPGGHIDAWEGTTVTITARTNSPVTSAYLAFSDDERLAKAEEVPMTVTDGTELRGKWTLAYRSDGTYARFYRIQCRNAKGETDPQPTLYNVTIRPDQPPEVLLRDPQHDLEMPANGVVPLLIEARDPDFLLRFVNLRVEKQGEPIYGEPLFDGERREFRTAHDLRLEPLNLAAGDVIRFWIEARDNKLPVGNRRNTPKLNIKIIDAVPEKDVQRQLDRDKQRQEELLEQQQQESPDSQNGAEEPAGNNETQQDGETRPGGAGDAEQDGRDRSNEGKSQSEGTQQTQEANRRLDPNGSDDDEVLRKLYERQKEREQSKSEGNNANQNQKDSSGNQGQQQPPQESKSADQQSRPNDADRANQPRESAQRDENGAHPDDRGAAEQSDRGDQHTSAPQPSVSEQGTPDGSAEPGNKTDFAGDNHGSKQTSEGGAQDSEDAGTEADASRDAKQSDKLADHGKTSGAEPSKNPPTEKGDPNGPTNQRQPADESPDAIPKPASGDETGIGTPEQNPDQEPVESQNDIQRKPGTEPATRPHTGENPNRDLQPPEPNSPKQGAPDSARKPDAQQDRVTQRPGGQRNQTPPSPDQSPSGNQNGTPQASERTQPADQDSQGGNQPGGPSDSQNQKSGDANGQSDQNSQPGNEPSQSGDQSSQGTGKPGGKKSAGGPQSSAPPSDRSGAPSGQPGNAPGRTGGGNLDPRRPPNGQNIVAGGKGPGEAGDESGGDGGSSPPVEETNPEFAKQAANLVLRRLEDDIQRRDVDPQLLEELGWTPEELQRFSNRLKRLLEAKGKHGTPEETAQQRQFEEMLRHLDLSGTTRTREGTDARDQSADGFAPRQNRPPAEYQERWEAFRSRLTRQIETQGESK